MKKKSTPAPRRAGTAKPKMLYSRRERTRREAVVVAQLDELSRRNPAKFDEMMVLLAKLVAETERDVSADPGLD